MKMFVCGLLVVTALFVSSSSGASLAPVSEKKELFSEAEAIKDQNGKELVTSRASGHPTVMDFNGDGKPDIILGCHTGMGVATAEILVLENVGTMAKPKFEWPAKKKIMVAGDKMFSSSCGCKSGGAFETYPIDWNADGNMDIVVNTYWTKGVVLLLNTGENKEYPVFKEEKKLFEIGQKHSRGSGGGDWNNDGILDYVHPVNKYSFTVYAGAKSPKGEMNFDKKEFSSNSYTLTGHDAYPPIDVKGEKKPAWFDHTPYAWNFSGKNPKGSKITEVIAVKNKADYDATEDYAQKKCDLNYYWLDREAKTCELKGRIAVNSAAATRLSIGDLNGDGSMDLLFTGGTFNKDGAGTKIWVMYGKVKNILK
jgi:hypothetical protein